MHRLVNALATLVRRVPATLLVAAIAATAVFAYFAGQAEMAQGNEGFAPENRELQALETVGERFAESSETVMQVLVSAPDGGDVISADGVATVTAIEEAVRTRVAQDVLSDRPERPAVVSFAFPVQQALAVEPSGAGSPALDDATVDEVFRQALSEMPQEQAAMASRLVADSSDLGRASARSGLVLVFLNTAEITAGGDAEAGADFDAIVAEQERVAAAVETATLPTGFDAQPFAFELLFADTESFETEVGRLFALAFAIILVILGFVYFVRPRGGGRLLAGLRRTAGDVLLTLATIVMSITWMQGLGVLLGPEYLGVIGKFSPPTQIVPILLIGLGVDYAIHLNSRYREEIGNGAAPDVAAMTASRTVGVALVLATVTTAVGFLTNITNPLPALKDFGILSAVGIVAAFVLMLTFVPAVRLLLDRRGDRHDRLPRAALRTASDDRMLPRIMARTAVLAQRFAVGTLVVTVGLGLLGGYGLTRLSTEFSFTDFVPEDSPLLGAFERLRDDFEGGLGETTDVVLEGDLARPEAHNALVGALAEVGETAGVLSTDGVATAQSPISVLALLVTPPDDGGPAAPDMPTAYDPGFAQFAASNGLRQDLTVTPGGNVAAIYSRMLEVLPREAGAVLQPEGGSGFLALVKLQTTAGEQGAAQLAQDLREDFGALDDADVEVVPTSNNIVSAVIVRELQDSQVVSLVITLAAAMLLLVVTFWVQLRRPFLGVITAAPVVLVVLWTFGMMAATGIPFGPVTAVLSALAIGIGVPFTIHITHRFREDRVRHADPATAIASTVRYTGGALAGSAMTTVAGFAVLISSSLTPFRQMGQVTAYAIAFAFAAAVLVLPSMLILWDRWHRTRGETPVEVTDVPDLSTRTPEPV